MSQLAKFPLEPGSLANTWPVSTHLSYQCRNLIFISNFHSQGREWWWWRSSQRRLWSCPKWWLMPMIKLLRVCIGGRLPNSWILPGSWLTVHDFTTQSLAPLLLFLLQQPQFWGESKIFQAPSSINTPPPVFRETTVPLHSPISSSSVTFFPQTAHQFNHGFLCSCRHHPPLPPFQSRSNTFPHQ